MGKHDTANSQDIEYKVTFRLSGKAKHKLVKLAKEKGMSQNALVETLINRSK